MQAEAKLQNKLEVLSRTPASHKKGVRKRCKAFVLSPTVQRAEGASAAPEAQDPLFRPDPLPVKPQPCYPCFPSAALLPGVSRGDAGVQEGAQSSAQSRSSIGRDTPLTSEITLLLLPSVVLGTEKTLHLFLPLLK